MIYLSLWLVSCYLRLLRWIVGINYILAIHRAILRLNARGSFYRWVSRELWLLARVFIHLIAKDWYVWDRFLIPLSAMTASRCSHVRQLLIILLIFDSIIHLLFRPVLRVKKGVRIGHRIIRIEPKEWLHDCLLLLRVKFRCNLIFFLGHCLLRCLRIWRCRSKVVLLCTQNFWGHIPATIDCGHTILARLDLVHIRSYPVSVLAMLTAHRCLQRRVASTSPTWVSCFGVRAFPIIGWGGLVATEGVSELDALRYLILSRMMIRDKI
jgi:hypothetical protein